MFFQKPHPISQLILNRIFIAVIIALALISGYFYTENQRLVAKYGQDQVEKR